MAHEIPSKIIGGVLLVGVTCLLIITGVNATERVRDDDRFNWSSNVWVQPTWSSSWGVGRHNGYRDPWRVGIGFNTGYPYWNHHYRPYWKNSWRYPYRYERREYVEPKPRVITPPQLITTGVKVSHGIKSLPANARVKQKNGRMVYEWQGVEYLYDWTTESYKVIK
ncbi:hypothetical protein [Shewanella psychrotolerans]|uniref:hypothetical protein n=1 Tax=Shewanella psychrotolerans TaxID=2864206 RepID=UPI001C6609F6|nr:hypothetical protein [Shewanella psychrotolerans]QYK01128.1 hypothetical protein K0I62_17430 [Shewanella psychrotolerans]